MNPGYRKRTIILLLVLLVVRFWFGQTFQLTGREAYLWLEGHGINLSPGYWERGPMTPWLIRIGTALFGDTELGVRWLAAMITCGTGFTLFYLARHWFNARTAFWTTVLFVVVPMFAWKLSFMTEATVSVGLMAGAIFGLGRAIEERKLIWWLLGGAACGLGLIVSIANAWWGVGLLIYLLIDPTRRERLRDPKLWSAVVFALLFLTPVAWWWHGAQVADIRHSRLINDWPLTHPFSFLQGLHFIALEITQLSPFFAIALVVILVNLGRGVWKDSHLALLLCLAVPGLAWENFASFFAEANFELVPALFLPLLLLAGCAGDRICSKENGRSLAWSAILLLATLQSFVGIKSFYQSHAEGWHGHRSVFRVVSDEALAGLEGGVGGPSWRALADQMVQMQREAGANLIITDQPSTASALTFYMPRHPAVYVESDNHDEVTQFDFWQQFNEAASSNDSALFITRSQKPPPEELVKNFTSVTQMPDMPDPQDAKEWNLWKCDKFTGTQEAPGADAASGHVSEPLPK